MIRKFTSGLKRDLKDESFLEIIKGSGATFLIRVGGLLAGYAFIFLISRIYGSEVLGAHTISVTVLMVFTIIGRFGLDTAIVRHFAGDHQSGRWDRIREVYFKTLNIIIPVGIFLSVILYFSSGLLAERIFHKPLLEPYFKIISIAVLPMVMRFVNSECYRGFRMNREYAYSQSVSYFLYASFLLAAISVFYKDELLPNLTFSISLFILAISSTFLLLKRINKHSNVSSSEFNSRSLLNISLPMMLTGSMMLISGWINTLMLGVYSTESVVGIWSVVMKIANLPAFVLISINSVSAPRFAQLHQSGNHDGLKKYAAHTAKIIFLSSVPIFLVTVLFREWLLGLFGKEFVSGSTALLIVMAGQVMNVFAGSVGHFLNMTGHQVAMRNIITISTVINIILCILLIPKYGIIGSAIAGMVFTAMWNLSAMIYIRKKFKIRTYYWPFSVSRKKLN